MTISLIKTISIFEHCFLVNTEKAISIEEAENIIQESTGDYYQKHLGEMVKNVTVWRGEEEEAIDWLHENDYW